MGEGREVRVGERRGWRGKRAERGEWEREEGGEGRGIGEGREVRRERERDRKEDER